MHHTSPLFDGSRSGPVRHGHRFYRVTTALTIFAMLFGGLLLLAAPAASANSNSSDTPTTSTWVNLRTEPSSESEIIIVLPDGTPLEITGEPESGFYPVNADGNWGYVSADFINWNDDVATEATGGSNVDVEVGDNGEDPADSGGDLPTDTGNAGATLYVIDGALNLRSGPSTSDQILTVMPNGSAVEATGESSNGFLGVTYRNQTGWAYSEYLSANGGGGETPDPVETPDAGETPDDGGGTDPIDVGDTPIASGVVSDGPLNLRAGPSTSNQILAVMPQGSSLEIMGDVQSGFHPVRYNGQKGWAYAEFVSVGGGGDTPDEEEPTDPDDGGVDVPGTDPIGTAMVIDGNLNLRSGPGTNYSILTVMRESSEVSLLGDPQNGFYPVRFNGQDGWAFADYLSTGGGNTPDPDPTPDPDDGGGDIGNGDTNGDGSYSRDELVAIINVAAAKYGQPAADMIRVAGCESVWDPRAVNSTSGASGLFQFMPGTWLTTPFADQDIFDPVANANAAAWMWSVGRRNEWSCQ